MEQFVIKGGTSLRGEVENGGAKNAALMAVSILALQDAALAEKLEAFRARQTADVLRAEL